MSNIVLNETFIYTFVKYTAFYLVLFPTVAWITLQVKSRVDNSKEDECRSSKNCVDQPNCEPVAVKRDTSAQTVY